MGILTKKTRPPADYHTWEAADLADGDIIDFVTSLGGRYPRSVAIESLDGQSIVRFNVVSKAYQTYNRNKPYGPQGSRIPSTGTEQEIVKDNITIETGDRRIWTLEQIAIADLKIVTKSPGLKISIGGFVETSEELVGETPTFQLFNGDSSVLNVPSELYIHGVTKDPVLRYNAQDASVAAWPAWDYGVDLSLVGSGTDPVVNDGSPLTGSREDSVAFQEGKSYQEATAGSANLTTEDMVIEALVKVVHTSGTTYLAGNSVNGVDAGWHFVQTAGGSLQLKLDDGATSANVGSSNLSDGAWYHVMIFVDKSGSAQVYINGSASGAAVSFASVGNITNALKFTVGAAPNLAGGFGGNIAYLSMWVHDAWLDTHLQATVAETRFLQISGIYPQIANGSALPSTRARASNAYLDKVENNEIKLYRMGDGWLRVCTREDLNGVPIRGFLPELADENELLWSEDFSNAAWTGTRLASFDTDGQISPDGSTTMDGLVGTAVDNTHYVTQSISSSAATHFVSVFAKPGDQDWLYIESPSVANANCYFNVSTGEVGTAGAAATGHISRKYKNGSYKCIMQYTGGAAAHDHNFYAAAADGDNTYLGDGSTVNLWLWGAQHWHTVAVPFLSYIKTESSIATRAADVLRFQMDDGNFPETFRGTMKVDFLSDVIDATANYHLMLLSDGGSAADRFTFIINPSNKFQSFMATTGGDQGNIANGTEDVTDKYIHAIRVPYQINSLSQYINGVQDGTTDTLVSIPNDIDRLDVGSFSSGFQFCGLICNLRFFKTFDVT